MVGAKRNTSDAARQLQALLSEIQIGSCIPGEHALAKMLGISRPTVRNLLAGYVQQAILESRPGDGTYLLRRVSAPASDTGMASAIGVIVRELRVGWHPRAISALQSDLLAKDRHILLKSSEESAERELEHLLQLWRAGVQRIITFPNTANLYSNEYRQLIRTLIDSGVRLVAIDNPIFGCDAPSVSSDHVQSGFTATHHLIDNGHRDILILGPFSRGSHSHRDRLNGYLTALHTAGITPSADHQLDTAEIKGDREAASRLISDYLDRHDLDFTAMFATRDDLASGAIRALQERGVKIPEEVSVVGFGDDFRDEARGVFLTSLEHPLDQIARRALELLSDDALWPSGTGQRHLFPTRLIKRDSVKRLSGSVSAG